MNNSNQNPDDDDMNMEEKGENQVASTSSSSTSTMTGTMEVRGESNGGGSSSNSSTRVRTIGVRRDESDDGGGTIDWSNHSLYRISEEKIDNTDGKGEATNKNPDVEETNKEEKRQRRLAQNRKTAKLRRDSDRLYLERLQNKKNVLAYKNECLKKEGEELRKHHSLLQTIISQNQQVVVAVPNHQSQLSSLNQNQPQQLPLPPPHGQQVGQSQGSLNSLQSLQLQESLLRQLNPPSLLTMPSVVNSLIPQQSRQRRGQQYHGYNQEQVQEVLGQSNFMNTAQRIMGNGRLQQGGQNSEEQQTTSAASSSGVVPLVAPSQNQPSPPSQFENPLLLNQISMSQIQRQYQSSQQLPYSALLNQRNLTDDQSLASNAATIRQIIMESFSSNNNNNNNSSPRSSEPDSHEQQSNQGN